ncbi:unnamed protein product [Schistosoma mattheei]|uniref:Uncharacterized protein n=1 Tax=Schistosoma mattheei TaxID=31246 RepID=A0A183NMD6_9TREM|nr:unnamed protein product [Schistosoma mattheei]
MEDNWKGVKEAPTSTFQDVMNRKKNCYDEWISIETLHNIEEKKNKKTEINSSRISAVKVKAQSEYIEANKQEKNIRVDEQKYLEELATIAEIAAREGNMRQQYNTGRKIK